MASFPPIDSHYSSAAFSLECSLEVALPMHIDRLRSLGREKDLYPLLAFSIPEVADKNALFLELKGALKEALTVYTINDPGEIARARGIVCGKYHLVKIIGEDYRPFHQSLENLQKRAEDGSLTRTELQEQYRELFARYEETFSPYRVDKSTFFKVTPDAARALCQILAETPAIDALTLVSSQEEGSHECSFGDEVATILANELPKGRFSLLQISGSFGDKGLRAFADQLPLLLTRNPLDPKDINVNGEHTSKETIQELEAKVNTWLVQRQEENPNSIVNKRDLCVVM